MSLWPPTRSGTAVYSWKLYKLIAISADILILSNHSVKDDILEVRSAWRSGSLAVFHAIKSALEHRRDAYHIQFEFLMFGHPTGILFLPILAFALRLTGKPIILTIHSMASKSFLRQIGASRADNPYMELFQRLLYFLFPAFIVIIRTTCLLSTKVIVHNELMQKVLVHEYKINMKKIRVIPHGIDHANHRTTESHNGENPKILFFGFLRPSKGVDFLIHSMSIVIKEFPKAKLILAGSGPYQQEAGDKYMLDIQKIVRSLELKNSITIMRRFLSESELSDLIDSSDIIVLPYLEYFIEASGVLCRLVDFGKALVCTRVPKFTSELNEGVDCLMVHPGDVAGLADSLVRLLRNPPLRENLANNLRMKSTSRYWEDVAKEHVKLYRNILEGAQN